MTRVSHARLTLSLAAAHAPRLLGGLQAVVG